MNCPALVLEIKCSRPDAEKFFRSLPRGKLVWAIDRIYEEPAIFSLGGEKFKVYWPTDKYTDNEYVAHSGEPNTLAIVYEMEDYSDDFTFEVLASVFPIMTYMQKEANNRGLSSKGYVSSYHD